MDRGLGHYSYAVITEGQLLVVKCKPVVVDEKVVHGGLDLAQHIVNCHNRQLAKRGELQHNQFKQASPKEQMAVVLMALEGYLDNCEEGIIA